MPPLSFQPPTTYSVLPTTTAYVDERGSGRSGSFSHFLVVVSKRAESATERSSAGCPAALSVFRPPTLYRYLPSPITAGLWIGSTPGRSSHTPVESFIRETAPL